MAITDKTEFKAKAEEYTAVANAIRVLMGQPLYGQTGATPYEFPVDYIAKLTTLNNLLERISNTIGGSSQETGIGNQLADKIDSIKEQINNILDPDGSSQDVSIFNGLENFADLVDRLNDISEGDSQIPNDKSPSEIITEIEDAKDIIETIINPQSRADYPLDDVIDELDAQIDNLRDLDPPAQEPDTRSLGDVINEISSQLDEKRALEELIAKIEEAIHEVAIITGEEDPETEESIEISKQYINDTADEIYELMDEEDLDWEDLTDDQKLIIEFDDLLDYIEGLEAEVDEYRNGGFQLIETSSAVSGAGIFDTIQNLETARRATMTPAQKEEEKTVVYISRCLFNTTESFICTGLIDGVRKNGAFFYRDSATNNFYNTSAPTSNAKLGAGKYLIRVILREEAYFDAEI